jgi:hypothetical protein
VTVIPDALEYDPVPPRRTSTKIGVWFGHGSNVTFLIEYFQKNAVAQYFDSLIICSDAITLATISKITGLNFLPRLQEIVWSVENLRRALLEADFAFLPLGVGNPRKAGAGANRLMTALCLGLPVYTQPIVSYKAFEHYFTNINDISWGQDVFNKQGLRETVLAAQKNIIPIFSPKIISKRWEVILDTEVN